MAYHQFNQPVMWKNVFLESCILSALIFGGFYLNATHLQNELYSQDNKNSSAHISGLGSFYDPEKHISGQKSPVEPPVHLSGSLKPSKTQR